MIPCLICGKQLNLLGKHITSHGITKEDYLLKFPDALLVDPETSAKYSKNSINVNAKRDYSVIGEKSSATKQRMKAEGHDFGASRRGYQWSDESRKKLSKSKKMSLLKNGHPRSGIKLTDETKQKIRHALTGRTLSESHLENLRHAYEERMKNGYKSPLIGRSITSETKANISKGLLKYRQACLTETKIKFEEICKTYDISLLDLSEDGYYLSLKCDKCNHQYSRTRQIFIESTKEKEMWRCDVCHPRQSGFSKGELEVFDFIKSLGVNVIWHDTSILKGKELDIYLPDHKLAIEYNGLYWHSTAMVPDDETHQHLLTKQKWAWKEGVRVIHLFEDEWLFKQDIVKSRLLLELGLGASRRIFARQCSVIEIDNKTKKQFLIENHLQGDDASKTRLGLMFNDELVSVMTFKKASIDKGQDGSMIELSRFASKSGVQVVGGASKLLSYFRKIDSTPIITYADRRWSSGKLYHQLGFEFLHNSPASYWYVDGMQRKHRSSFMKHTLVKTEEDKLLTEKQLTKRMGLHRIYDCGTMVFRLKYK